MIIILCIIFMIITYLTISFNVNIKNAYKQLNAYDVKKIDTQFGTMSYVDAGYGESILISHGIFGGYDQGYESLYSLVGDGYRKISVSRFGYPGSNLPSEATPENQAKVFEKILDELGIEKVFILTTSAGGAAGIKFAINYPNRVKGLILLSSGVPSVKKSRDEIIGMLGPPEFIVNDFSMWFSTKYFGFIFRSMFGSEIDENLYKTMLPVSPRKQGIKEDTYITNLDMNVNFDAYPVEKITAPIIVLHAKDDPMVKYSEIKKFIDRVHPKTKIFESGGHLISGNGDEVSKEVISFIENIKS